MQLIHVVILGCCHIATADLCLAKFKLILGKTFLYELNPPHLYDPLLFEVLWKLRLIFEDRHTTWPPPTKTENWVWLALWSISLSYYLLLRVTSNLVSDESYWQRCCKSRWEVCDVAKHDNSWKRMYFERNLEGA